MEDSFDITTKEISENYDLLISFMEELTSKDIKLIKQCKYEEVIESVKQNL